MVEIADAKILRPRNNGCDNNTLKLVNYVPSQLYWAFDTGSWLRKMCFASRHLFCAHHGAPFCAHRETTRALCAQKMCRGGDTTQASTCTKLGRGCNTTLALTCTKLCMGPHNHTHHRMHKIVDNHYLHPSIMCTAIFKWFLQLSHLLLYQSRCSSDRSRCKWIFFKWCMRVRQSLPPSLNWIE